MVGRWRWNRSTSRIEFNELVGDLDGEWWCNYEYDCFSFIFFFPLLAFAFLERELSCV